MGYYSTPHPIAPAAHQEIAGIPSCEIWTCLAKTPIEINRYNHLPDRMKYVSIVEDIVESSIRTTADLIVWARYQFTILTNSIIWRTRYWKSGSICR
jgi:hypothetical protein